MTTVQLKPGVQMTALTMVGIFAGIGGFELGFRSAGIETTLLCEVDPEAQAILRKKFPKAVLIGDVSQLQAIGSPHVLCAGFPCQDLSQAGTTAGIDGAKSSLIRDVFRVLQGKQRPAWIVLENVPFMLHLGRGAAMAYVISELENLGYKWAYRVINSNSFGLPQRRRRVYIVASRDFDPRGVLLNDNAEVVSSRTADATSYGFYWTEGNTGLGWAKDSIPTLKGGSGLGIPSPPAIWIVGEGLFVPDIRDAERLQGFRPDWTAPDDARRSKYRWRLVGNAVSVPAARYLAHRIAHPPAYSKLPTTPFSSDLRWPLSAWGYKGKRFGVELSEYPVRSHQPKLTTFLKFPGARLSRAAAAGFLQRAKASRLRFQGGFIEAVESHISALANETERR